MIVKLKTSVSGPYGSFSPGIRDLPEDLAYEMIDAGFAEKTSKEREADGGEVSEKQHKKKRKD